MQNILPAYLAFNHNLQNTKMRGWRFNITAEAAHCTRRGPTAAFYTSSINEERSW